MDKPEEVFCIVGRILRISNTCKDIETEKGVGSSIAYWKQTSRKRRKLWKRLRKLASPKEIERVFITLEGLDTDGDTYGSY